MDTKELLQWAADIGSGYSCLRPLDEGVMGTVCRAHKDSLDVDVVIKRVKQKFHGQMNERAEADILKKLKHKYLPRIYDIINSPSGYVYTIMDYIYGENMQKYVAQHGPVGQKLAYRWACELCEAVSYLHDQTPPILHCDIKPSNVMITPTGDICVIDFNTSRVLSKGMLAIGATPGFAAPEQYARTINSDSQEETVPLEATMPLRGYANAIAYKNSKFTHSSNNAYSATVAKATNAGNYGTISERTDVYGIGATIYFAVTGQRPAHSLENVKPISSYKCHLSKAFQVIITQSMRKQQTDRFQDAKAMLHALQNVHLIDKRYKYMCRFQEAIAGISALMAVAGGIILFWGVQRIGQERNMRYDSLVRSGRTAGEAMQFEDAERDLQQAIEIYDNRLEAYTEQAVLLYRQGKYQECVDEISSILTRPLQYESNQTVANLYYTAAKSYDTLEEYENAVRMYRKAIAYMPEQPIYYQSLTATQLELGDLTGAQATLHEMESQILNASDTTAYQVAMGTILYRQNDLDEALEVVQNALKTDGEEEQLAQAYLLAAKIYEAKGDRFISEEISLLESGLQTLSPIYYNIIAEPLAATYIRQADIHFNTDSLSKALELYQQIERNGNESLELRLSIAIVQYRMQNFTAAEDTLLKLSEDYSDDYRVYKWLAFNADAIQIQRDGSNYVDAREYWAQANRLYENAQAAGVSDPEMDKLAQLADRWP